MYRALRYENRWLFLRHVVLFWRRVCYAQEISRRVLQKVRNVSLNFELSFISVYTKDPTLGY